MEGLAHKIRYARRHKNLSQRELGKLLGISEMAISAYETNRAIPPWPALKKIGEITGFAINYFTEEENEHDTLKSLQTEIKEIKKGITKIITMLNEHK